MNCLSEKVKAFYESQYTDGRYADYKFAEAHPFFRQLEKLMSCYGDRNGKWLEVVCGRELLQDFVYDYTGVDLAEAVSGFIHKPFHCAPAEALPFPDSSFDGIWSYAVLEHVMDAEKTLLEMRRTVKPHGKLLLAPAWQCRPWAGRDYAWKPYAELSLRDRIMKALIPLLNSVGFRMVMIGPVRLFRLLGYFFHHSPTDFRCRQLKPSYTEYRVADADARNSIDPFEMILWFRSRGDRVLSHPGWRQAFFVRTGAIVIEVMK